MKILRYLINLSIKAFNDALKVYEAKLTDLDIDISEVAFQPIHSRVSKMPIGLVAKP